ncbi:long-chain-acyl-CoA synthetase [Pseudomonas sp. ICMP22404]|uniref:long-chain-acyl-CoA synthetase n=1 Tax=Pseudomonas sp. ICMP22404 TaxID=2583807 RepID=UPI00111A8722|nr:long-chain-acyl-CoA synthetase [Pseudomonas sp. ICMP22404]TNF79659.1 long-chain-acyl-CoA synthetase [Pseudomonas sp. ICMP22404]
MSRIPSDAITWGMMLRKLPALVSVVPRIVKGRKLVYVRDPAQPCGLGWSFEQATQRNPQGPALLCGDMALSYAQVNEQANRIAHYWLAQGIGKGDCIAIFLENRPHLLITLLAVAKVGAVSAMLNTSQTGDALVHSLALVAPVAVVVGDERVPAFEEVRGRTALSSARTWWLADEQGAAVPRGFVDLLGNSDDYPGDNPASSRQVFFNDPCFYLYTSGTTGLPKAVIFRHGRWTRTSTHLGLIALDMRPDDVLYCPLPLYHATGLCMCWGAAICGASGFAIRRTFSAGRFWSDVRRYRVTTLGYAGELCRYLIDQPASVEDRCHGVKKMIGNGLRPGAWAAFKTRFGVEHICESYAASDGNIGFTNLLNFDNTVGFSLTGWALVQYDHGSGRPLRNLQGRMQKVPKGQPGLLLARIDDQAPLDGYTDPVRTEEAICRDVFAPGDRYFNTGDLLRDLGFGHGQFVDRLGDTYRWKGKNVSTTQVENVLLQHPQVAEAVAYGVEINGSDGRAGMAAITPSESLATLDFGELLQFLQARLPACAVPLFLRIKVKMDITGTFKYHKTRLRREAFDPCVMGDEPVYAWLPGSRTYVRVDRQLATQIQGGQFDY